MFVLNYILDFGKFCYAHLEQFLEGGVVGILEFVISMCLILFVCSWMIYQIGDRVAGGVEDVPGFVRGHSCRKLFGIRHYHLLIDHIGGKNWLPTSRRVYNNYHDNCQVAIKLQHRRFSRKDIICGLHDYSPDM